MVSRTAEYVAFYRALETTERSRPPLFRDPHARDFLSPSLRVALGVARVPWLRGLLLRYADHRAPGARSSAIGRTRFIDELVGRAVDEGVGQLVILGAGFDCRAHRLPALSGIRVFECDRAATQAVKRARVSLAPHITYVPIDFGRDELTATLRASGWDPARPTVFVWEGVTNYLDEAAVHAVLRTAAAGPSRIVFTYIHRGVLDGTASFAGADKLMANVRRLGEPWRFGFDPATLGATLDGLGLRLIEDVGADEYRARYLPPGSAGLEGYAFYRIAVALSR